MAVRATTFEGLACFIVAKWSYGHTCLYTCYAPAVSLGGITCLFMHLQCPSTYMSPLRAPAHRSAMSGVAMWWLGHTYFLLWHLPVPPHDAVSPAQMPAVFPHGPFGGMGTSLRTYVMYQCSHVRGRQFYGCTSLSQHQRVAMWACQLWCLTYHSAATGWLLHTFLCACRVPVGTPWCHQQACFHACHVPVPTL